MVRSGRLPFRAALAGFAPSRPTGAVSACRALVADAGHLLVNRELVLREDDRAIARAAGAASKAADYLLALAGRRGGRASAELAEEDT